MSNGGVAEGHEATKKPPPPPPPTHGPDPLFFKKFVDLGHCRLQAIFKKNKIDKSLKAKC